MNPISASARGARGVLLGLTIALAGGASLTAWARPDAPPAAHGAPGFLFGSPRQLDRLLDDVKASDAQRGQIHQIFRSAAADLKGQHEAGRALRDEQVRLFTQPTVDANAVEALRQRMLAQHDQTSKRMTQALLDASRVLTPEQRAQIAERMKARRDMMERHQRERRELSAPKG